MCFAADKSSARFARSVKAFLCCKYVPPLGLCISCCIYTWITLAAYATCDDYPHNAFLAQFRFISQTNKLDTSELHCKIAGSAAMSSIEKGNERAKENCSAVQVTLTRALKNNRAAKNAVADQTHRRCLENQQSQSMRHQKVMWCKELRETPSA